MSKPSGMKLKVPPVEDKKYIEPSFEDYDNQFLDNEEDMVSKNDKYQQEDQNNQQISQSQYLPINTIPRNISENIKDSERKRLKKLNNGMEKLSVSILQMKEKYKDLDMQEILFKKRNYKKQNQIKQFLSVKKTQKIQRIKNKRKRMERQAKSLQQSINLEQQEVKNKQIEAVKQNLIKIKQWKHKKESENKQKAEKDKMIAQMYEKIHTQEKAKPKFHLRKLEQDRKQEEKRAQQQKKYLAKRRENFKPFQNQQFETHSKRHQQLLSQLQTVKKSQREEEYLKILENNKKLEDFYRGRTYDFVVEQVEERKHKREQPTEKIKKMRNYQDYVRENFIPIIKEKQIDNNLEGRQKHSSMSHREVKRYRYLQGVSYGEIIENRPVAKSQAQQRKMGNEYMAFMRSLPKRRYDEDNFLQQSSQQIARQLKLKQKKPNPLAERSGRKSVEVKVSDKPTRDQLGMLMQQLQNKDKQIQRKQKVVRNSAGIGSPNANVKIISDDLVFNIERKLNLLSKL